MTLDGLAPLLADGSAAVAFTVAEKATYALVFTAGPAGSSARGLGHAADRRGGLARADAQSPRVPGAPRPGRQPRGAGPLPGRPRPLAAGHRRAPAPVPRGGRAAVGDPVRGAAAGARPLLHRGRGPGHGALAHGPRRLARADGSRASGDELGVPRHRSADFGTARAPLPSSGRHVRALAALYGPAAHTLLDRAATEERAKAQMRRARVLHFATHGVFEPASPLYSALLLAPASAGSTENGRLEAREILDMDLGADLAVLSACETARGRIGAGEGVIGLSWAFSVAGVRNTVVSLWSVDAASTADLMLEFHRVSRRGAEYPEALRAAALKLLRNARRRHPFYWAPFVLIGDGRRSGKPRPRTSGS